jgi:hypothetical protein
MSFSLLILDIASQKFSIKFLINCLGLGLGLGLDKIVLVPSLGSAKQITAKLKLWTSVDETGIFNKPCI